MSGCCSGGKIVISGGTSGTIVDNGDGTATVTLANGATGTFCTSCGDGGGGGTDTFATFLDNNDGTGTFISADGTSTLVVPTTTTTTYVEGDVLTYDVTLPDGTILSAGDPVPPGVIFINEENLDGTLVTSAATCCSVSDDCCQVSNALIDPATGGPVIVVIDTTDGSVTYYDSNGQPWEGDAGTLVLNASGTGDGAVSILTDNGDGSFTHSGDGATSTTVGLCDLLDGLAVATTPLPDGALVLGDDCTWYELEKCCFTESTLVDPVTGSPVVVVIDTTSGAATYYDATGQPWIGDPTTLTTGGSTPVCNVVAGTLTGTAIGAYTHSCSIEPMPADGDPETAYPAAGFPELWQQSFSDGVTGTETWIVQNDTNGSPQWHQLA